MGGGEYLEWESLLQVSPSRRAIVLCGSFAALCFVVSTMTQNYSQVDKLWSITPVIYAWMAVRDERTFLMALLATVWGVRLTYNFYRRGGYHWPPWCGDEDYRWQVLQKGGLVRILTNPVAWMVFNLTFISIYQNFLLLFLAAPAFATCDTPLGPVDYLLALVFLVFVGTESIADNAQYRFQQEKYRRIQAGEKRSGEYLDGFTQSGIFAIVRKPNYASEQALWITFFLLTVSSGAPAANWTIFGWIQLCVLFQSSGWLTEKITKGKYPKYKQYTERVPLYIPNILALFGSKADNKKS